MNLLSAWWTNCSQCSSIEIQLKVEKVFYSFICLFLLKVFFLGTLDVLFTFFVGWWWYHSHRNRASASSRTHFSTQMSEILENSSENFSCLLFSGWHLLCFVLEWCGLWEVLFFFCYIKQRSKGWKWGWKMEWHTSFLSLSSTTNTMCKKKVKRWKNFFSICFSPHIFAGKVVEKSRRRREIRFEQLENDDLYFCANVFFYLTFFLPLCQLCCMKQHLNLRDGTFTTTGRK